MLIRSILIATFLTTACQPTSAQEISKRVLERAKDIKPSCSVPVIDCNGFRAVVRLRDRHSYLNVWTFVDPNGRQKGMVEDVSGILREGDIVYVDRIFTRDGKKMAEVLYAGPGCEDLANNYRECGRVGSVDLRYLR
jgi:hypothetical protein